MKNEYIVNGSVACVLVKRNSGLIDRIIVDSDDLERISEFPNTWNITQGYAYGHLPRNRNKRGYVSMHRLVMDAPKGSVIDHINHNTLDNRKANLRICSTSENAQNRLGAQRNSKSGIRGVTWDEKNRVWIVTYKKEGQIYQVGRFRSKEEARKASIAARKENFPFYVGESLYPDTPAPTTKEDEIND
jgi:hypothetical protein